MKYIISFFALLSVFSAKCQIAIGKPSVTNTSVSLEFAETENRGLILPYITDKSGINTLGSLFYDTTDHKVKLLSDTNTWFDFSVDTTGTADLSIQGNDKTELSTSKIAIGVNSSSDASTGIFVLADSDKAMVLPKVQSPHLNIVNPSAGMMVYDKNKRQLAIFNGTVWSFWKP